MSYLSSGPNSVEHGLGARVIREDIIARGHIGVDFVPCELASERVLASLTRRLFGRHVIEERLLNLGVHFVHESSRHLLSLSGRQGVRRAAGRSGSGSCRM
jgi:hypothetical protein